MNGLLDNFDSQKTRRDAMKTLFGGVCAAALASGAPAEAKKTKSVKTPPPDEHKGIFIVKEIKHYKKLKGKVIECQICPKKCQVGDQERGYCGNKENRGGKYYTLAYGNPCAMHVDPIEKKPFFHFLPGTLAFSLSTAGCNFNCKFCQNWELSQSRPEQTENVKMTPADVTAAAKRSGSMTIAYTYGEPVVYYEYVHDCAAAARKSGVRSVMISNGYINSKPMAELVKTLDAVKIDLKAYTEKFYKDTCDGKLKHVLETLELLKERKKWFEIVYLVIPTLNDKKEEIAKMSKWIVKNLGADVPIHFSRFHPTYMLKNLPDTPVVALETARRVSMDAGMNFVYIGNVPGHEGESTYCPKCGRVVIRRVGYQIVEMELNGGKCRCGKAIPGVWS